MSTLTLLPNTAALRVRMPTQDNSTPTHLIALIDASESMDDSNKLEHVKYCMSLVLRILSPADSISVITFGDQATTLLRGVAADAANVPAIQSAIDQIHTNGCTNLSDGLLAVRAILESGVGNASQKPLLLLLTDGHANRGISSADQLLTMLQRIQETYPALSISSIAYGLDHNADLLKALAERSHGAYSIIKSLEDAALSIGDSLGAVMSCVAQNVTVHVPPGTVAHGPYKVTDGKIVLGDGYSGAETLLLLDFPTDVQSVDVRVSGTRVPSLEPLDLGETVIVRAEADPVVELTRLRYRVADMFTTVRGWTMRTTALQRDQTLNQVHDLREAINAAAFAGQPLVAMLNAEIESLLTAIQRAASVGVTADLSAHLAQHAAFTSLERGTTRAISPVHQRRRRRAPSDEIQEEGENPAPHAVPRGMTSFMSPNTTARQREVASLMHTMSQGGNV